MKTSGFPFWSLDGAPYFLMNSTVIAAAALASAQARFFQLPDAKKIKRAAGPVLLSPGPRPSCRPSPRPRRRDRVAERREQTKPRDDDSIFH
jgi:hypothetical protein